MSERTAANRRHWNAKAGRYQATHELMTKEEAEAPLRWGAWGVPEAETQALGDVTGLTILEYGCGSAQWAARLSGATVVGLDQSDAQLQFARIRRADLPLVLANGERLPFAPDVFDLVFCDHGVMSWADPFVTVPEVARVLRPRGRLVFSQSSPIASLFEDTATGGLGRTLNRDYFGLHEVVNDDDGSAWFNLPYGEWIRLFARNGLVVEDLVELRPPATATNRFYAEDPPDWHHRWPAENVWVTRKTSPGDH